MTWATFELSLGSSMRRADWLVETVWYQLTNQLCALTLPWEIEGQLENVPADGLFISIKYHDV